MLSVQGGHSMSEVTVTSLSNLQNEVSYGAGRSFITDEPLAAGGEDAGPDPYVLILSALGSCISMTTMLYARRKSWPLEKVIVRLRQKRIHVRSEEHTSELQSQSNLVCRLLLEKKKNSQLIIRHVTDET